MAWEQTRAQLDYIEDRCKTMKREAGKLQDMLQWMKGRPNFETLCENEMKSLEADIGLLYAFIKASCEHYKRLPENA